MNRTAPLWYLAAIALGCSKPEGSVSPAASTSSSVTVARAAPAAPIATPPTTKTDAWFAGTWRGTYDAQHYEIEVPKNEGARDWKADDGGTHSGEGKITLEVSVAGVLRGSASGPLGAQILSGEVDGETFRVRMQPIEPGERAFHGYVLLTRQGDKVKGRLQASSGDSRTVRDAAVELSKSSAAATGSAPTATDSAPDATGSAPTATGSAPDARGSPAPRSSGG